MSTPDTRPHTPPTPRRPRGQRRAAQARNAPPVVPARVAVLKANYRQAWLMFLFILSLVIAWGVPLHYFIMRRLTDRPQDRGVHDQYAFVALAYEGVSTSPREVSPERFRQHLETLRAAGYNPITLEEVHALYAEGKPLPRKAILLTFDHSRKSSYFDVRSVLARAGWPAVMFLWTKPIEDEDPAALRWPYIRTMLRSGNWEAGAQSHHGFEQVVADSEGQLQNFMTAPRWLTEEMRFEEPQAFRERLRADHIFTRDLITQRAGQAPRAFAFPYGDYGQYDERAVLSRRINMELVGEFYDLGFIHGFTALNTRHSDPRRLSRLLVQSHWTGDELLERLDNAWPRQQGFQAAEARDNPHLWLQDWGVFEQDARLIQLRATPETTGAKVWINGSDLFQDFRSRFRLQLEQGQVGFYLRAAPDGERHVYLGIDHRGNVWLRQKHVGLPAFTLGSEKINIAPNQPFELELHLRGRHFFVRVNGRALFSEVLTLRGATMPGMLGLSVWDPEPGAATVRLSRLEVEPFVNRVVAWTPVAARDQRLAAWLQHHAVQHTHFAPPWLRVATRTQGEQPGWDPTLFRDLAHTYDLRFTPEIVLEGLAGQEDGLPQQLAAAAAEQGADGLLCNLTEIRGDPPLARITAWLLSLSQALDEHELELLVRLPTSWERESTLSALLQSLPNLQVAFAPHTYQAMITEMDAYRLRLAHMTRLDLAELEPPDIHTLTGGDAEIEDWGEVSRHQLLRSQGHAALERGDLEQALLIWGRWSELEPHNATPPRLRGDIYLRLNQYDEAIRQYRESLERNPGQIPLAAETARLLDRRADQPEEAGALLELYARLFPGNPDILLAQAQLLIGQNRRSEAGTLVRRVVEQNPEDLEALALLHSLLRRPASRRHNLQQMLAIGRRPGLRSHFADILRQHEILLHPEAWLLMPFVEDEAQREQASERPGSFSRLLPRHRVAMEVFRHGQLSNNWEAIGDLTDEEDADYLLAAEPSAAEASLRLAQSDLMHSGIIEAEIGEARGMFWLYARRSQAGMVRFGFDSEGRLYLQVWQGERLLNNLTRSWQHPGDVTTLRLEVRGDGAMGYIDGAPAFGAPMRVPESVELGWWGLSPWAPQLGVAEAVIRRLAGGPLPVQIAAFRPQDTPWRDKEMIAALTPFAMQLQAVAPTWFVHEMDGHITAEQPERFRDLRLLTRYYQIRLLPTIRAAVPRNLDFEELAALAEAERLDGFTLLFVRMPDERWFAQAEAALQESGLNLLAVRVDTDQEWVEVRELGPRLGLFPGRRQTRQLVVEPSPDAPASVMLMPTPEGQGDFEPPPHRWLWF